MICVDRWKGPFRYRRRWFAREMQKGDSGLTVYSQFLGKVPPKGWVSEEFLTLHSLLDSDRDGHLARMKKNTVYEVKRAEKDGVMWEPISETRVFLEYYNLFAKEKNIGQIKSAHLTSLGPSLFITRASIGEHTAAYHVYILDREEKRARLLYSAGARFTEGADRAALGRANRYAHLEDMLKLQELGFQIYDWGGITEAGSDPEREGINQFKLGFGGFEVREPHYYSPMLTLIKKILGKK